MLFPLVSALNSDFNHVYANATLQHATIFDYDWVVAPGGTPENYTLVRSHLVKRQGGGGKMTTYWDCCMGACAGKVNTCGKDGKTPMKGSNGCTGGDTFVCNNQQPFLSKKDKNHGYAFAASKGECCSCWKLNFGGKTLTVQIINTGSDLSGDQFDIQVPGGGFGIFDGCTPQWGGGFSWGARYGGTGGIGECDNIPKPLRKGCRFKFNFLQAGGMNSISVSKAAKCPKKLIKRSGCQG